MNKTFIIAAVFFAIIAALALRLLKRTYFDGKPLRNLMREYGINHQLLDSEDGDLIRYYVYINKVSVTAFTTVLKEGVYIGSVLVCSAVIPWENISNIVINKKSKSYKWAELHLNKNGVITKGIYIPWSRKYGEIVPSITGLDDKNA